MHPFYKRLNFNQVQENEIRLFVASSAGRHLIEQSTQRLRAIEQEIGDLVIKRGSVPDSVESLVREHERISYFADLFAWLSSASHGPTGEEG